MPSSVPPSSPPAHSHAGSSELSLRTSQLSSPQLPYKTIQQPPNQSKDDPIRATSPLDPPDNLSTEFLAAFNDNIESGSEAESIQGRGEQAAEAAANQVFLDQDLESDNESDDEFDDESDDESDNESDDKSDDKSDDESDKTSDQNNKGPARTGFIPACSTTYAREKLVRILSGEAVVPKQRWGIDKILTTLTYHRKDKRLSSSYRKFKRFAFSTLLQESDKSSASGRLPGALTQKDWDLIIKLRAKSELEKRYRREIQSLCRTSCFGAVKTEPGVIDKHPLEDIVDVSLKKAPLLCSLVIGVGPTSCFPSSTSDLHLVSMKVIAVLVILCRSAHRNNSNYFPLLIALYMYSAGAKVDAITLLNHLGLSVSYKVLQSKLREITLMNKKWIKQQANNCQLVGTWDNFEYRENVHGERIGDTVKFRSITMALWIQKGWRIPKEGLKQTMWNPKSDVLKPRELTRRAIGPDIRSQRDQCIRHHRFASIIAGFPDYAFSYSAPMPKVDVIDCKTEGSSSAFPFAPAMASENTTAGNISVFEDLNINQLGLTKDDPRFNESLYIWWGDLKTEVQMLSMQNYGIGMDRPYDRYQHIFPGLALWHLRFNYLKMVWEVFYPGGSASERSTLQWAADHWHRDKTTRPTDFHSLEDLTIHSYRARIIAMLKPWVHQQNKRLQLHNPEILGNWLSKLSSRQWTEAMSWLDARMKDQRTTEFSLNDHWNNHVRFCNVMEAYLTLCWSIKFGDVGLLRDALREVTIILQAPSAKKPKYAREMLRQMHILDTTAADPVLQRAYIANALVNLRGLPFTFYEMDLLLEHQNGEFKRFRSDRGSSLQETDEMFKLHALSVDALAKIRKVMNQVIIGRERSGRHPTKDASFDIQSLADQLYRSRSTTPDGPEPGKIFFSENPAPDLWKEGLNQLHISVWAFNESLRKNEAIEDPAIENGNEASGIGTVEYPIEIDLGANEEVNELFSSARASLGITSNLANAYI